MRNDDFDDAEIHISSGTMVRAILIVALFALAWFLRDIILVVLTAVVLASAIEPLIRFIVHRGIPRLLALVLVYFFGAAFLGGVLYFFVPAIVDDVTRLARVAPQYFDLSSVSDPLRDSGVTATPAALPHGGSIEQGLLAGANFLDLLKNGVEEGGAVHSLSVFFGGFLSFILIIVLSFYLSAQERGIENFLRLISPVKSRTYIVDLWKRSQIKIGLWFQGQITLCLSIAAVAIPGLMVLGVESAIFLGVVMAVFELIPVFGPILAAVPAIAIAYTEGIRISAPGFNAALIVAGFYFFLQQVESHVLYPIVVRKVTGIQPVLVILALVIGAKMAGFLGVLIAIPITAILMEFLNDVAKERKIFEDIT